MEDATFIATRVAPFPLSCPLLLCGIDSLTGVRGPQPRQAYTAASTLMESSVLNSGVVNIKPCHKNIKRVVIRGAEQSND